MSHLVYTLLSTGLIGLVVGLIGILLITDTSTTRLKKWRDSAEERGGRDG